jgi:Alkylmercury lyase
VGYEQIRVTDELSRSVQLAVGMPLRGGETLGQLVKGIAAARWAPGPENLISGEPTRHQVRVDGRILHTFCFVDALMLPFVLGESPAVEVRSAGNGGLVRRDSGGDRDALPSPERFPFANRLRALGRALAAGRDRRPLAGRSVRPCARPGLGCRRGFRRRELPLLLSLTSRERREESPCRIS